MIDSASMSPEVPVGYYKFVQSADAERVAAGSFKLGSLHYYRLLEALSGSRFIGDRTDGRQVYEVGRLDSSNPRDLQAMAQMGISVSGGGRIVMENSTIGKYDDGFVLSLAHGELPELSAYFAEERDGIPGYGAAIEITDVERFGHLFRAAVITFPDHLKGRRLGEVASSLRGGNVQYRAYGDGFAEGWSVDSMVKDPFFEEQREFRFAFQGMQNLEDDAVIVQLPDEAKDILKLVQNNQLATKPADEPTEDFVTVVQTLENAFADDPTKKDEIFLEMSPRLAKSYWAMRGKRKDRTLERALVRNERKLFEMGFDDWRRDQEAG